MESDDPCRLDSCPDSQQGQAAKPPSGRSCTTGICGQVAQRGRPSEKQDEQPRQVAMQLQLDPSSCTPQYCPHWLEEEGATDDALQRWSTGQTDSGYASRRIPGESMFRMSTASVAETLGECYQDYCVIKLAEKMLRERPPDTTPKRIHEDELDDTICPTLGPECRLSKPPEAPPPEAPPPPPPPDSDEEEEDTPAGVAAAMLHSEEQGMLMRAEPARIYNTLFQNPDELLVVTTGSPNPMQDVIVPLADEKMPRTSSRENLLLSASIVGDEKLPPTNVFTQKMKELGLYDDMMKPEPQDEEGDDGGDIEIKIDSTSYSSMHEAVPPETLEVMLDTALPAHFSRVQLRGSVPPDWFPGYFAALPNVPGMTNIVDCPVSVMEDAWESILKS